MTTPTRQLAGLLGPTLVVLSLTEAMNMPIFVAQTAPVVYLNGTLLFVAGLAILQSHHAWRRDWTTLITLGGWAALVLGLYRMIAPGGPQAGATGTTYAILAVLFCVGAGLSAAAYVPRRRA